MHTHVEREHADDPSDPQNRIAELEGIVESLRDATELKRAEEDRQRLVVRLSQALSAAERNRAQIEAVIKAISDGIVIFDTSGNAILVNEAEARINGFDSAEAMKRDMTYFADIYEICYLDGQPVPLEEWPASRVLRGESFVDWELRGKRRDTGQEWFFAFAGTPVRDEVGKQILAVVVTRDITERKRMEVERERLLHAERVAHLQAEAAIRARDEFLSVAAHELKTPVTSLRGYAQVLLRRLEKGGGLDAASVRRALSQIDRQSERLTGLVNQMLDLSRIDSGILVLSRQNVDITALLKRTVSVFRRMHERHHFVLESPSIVIACVDPLRLEQVFINLLDNAVKFSPIGSPVDVSVTKENGDAVQIVVRDHGIGIPEERRERVFDRFYQAHEADWHGGLGLGLFVTRQVVSLHGGSVIAEPALNGGTRIVVRIPIQGQTLVK